MKSRILLAFGVALVCVMGLFSALSSSNKKSDRPSVTTELVHQVTTQVGASAAT